VAAQVQTAPIPVQLIQMTNAGKLKEHFFPSRQIMDRTRENADRTLGRRERVTYEEKLLASKLEMQLEKARLQRLSARLEERIRRGSDSNGPRFAQA
jgi:hypothetical protein